MATATSASTSSPAAASGQGADDNYAATGQPGEASAQKVAAVASERD